MEIFLIHSSRRYISLLFFAIVTLSGAAQDITFRSLTMDDGLSQVSVSSLYQDERGFIWIGTREGLNCYNGHEIKTYRLEKNNPNSLLSNAIINITGNRDGKMYLLFADGVSRFDLNQEKSTTLLRSGEISSIYYNSQLFIGKHNCLYTFNEIDNELEKIFELPSKNAIISKIYVDSQNNTWAGTSNDGLYKLTKSMDGKLTSMHVIKEGNIENVYEDSDKDIWVGTWEYGLYRFGEKDVKRYVNKEGDNNSIGIGA